MSAEKSKAQKDVHEERAELVRRAQRGEEAAFSELYGLHKRRVYSLCLRMTNNVPLAEDLTQQAFLQLFRKIASFRGQSAFTTWLHRLVVNVVLMHLRKKGLNLVPLEDSNPRDEDALKRDYGKEDTHLTGVIDRLGLREAIDNLPPGYRSVFILHDVEGYEHEEIARMTSCSVGNSKSQLHKARLKLRGLLKQGMTPKGH